MNLVYAASFRRDVKRLSPEVRRRMEKQLGLFQANPRHPSLNMEKLEGEAGVWSIRVTRNFRITFLLQGDTATLRRVATHDEAYRRP
ncbi:MAG: type II toxin-antitoxin system RelE/ParE family toxin [Candidatus Methylomirabilis sp.]|nr:type II toxin-antitoxin system RelE/ParE family toxin [Deltaproteobacteria bacterium]